jgi:hypothetical protein
MRVDVYDGYVQCTQESHDSITLEALVKEVGYKNAIELVTCTLKFKAPLFIRMGIVKESLTIVDIPKSFNKVFIPDVSMIQSGNHELDAEIAEHIKQMAEVSVINIKGFQADGCDRFIAQTITPINVYIEFYAAITLSQMIRYSQQKLPVPVQNYVDAINDIVTATWPNLHNLKEKIGNGKEDLKKRTRKITRPSGRGDDNIHMSSERCSNTKSSCKKVQLQNSRHKTKTATDK